MSWRIYPDGIFPEPVEGKLHEIFFRHAYLPGFSQNLYKDSPWFSADFFIRLFHARPAAGSCVKLSYQKNKAKTQPVPDPLSVAEGFVPGRLLDGSCQRQPAS